MALPTLSLAGAAYGAIVDNITSGEPAVGIYYPQSPLGLQPMENEGENEYMLVTFHGIDGIGEIDSGFRGRDLTIELIIADTSKGGIETQRNALIAAMQAGTPAARFSVTIPGGTQRKGCRLTRNGCKILKPSFQLGTKICQWIQLNIRQLSTTN